MNKSAGMQDLQGKCARATASIGLGVARRMQSRQSPKSRREDMLLYRILIAVVVLLCSSGAIAAAWANPPSGGRGKPGRYISAVSESSLDVSRSKPSRIGAKSFIYARPGSVSMMPNASETRLTIVWDTGVYTNNQFGCSFDTSGFPYFELKLDQRRLFTATLAGSLRAGPGGICTFTTEYYYRNGAKLPAGVYTAEFNVFASGALRTAVGGYVLSACTPSRRRGPIYLGYHDALTDNFYTLSYSDSQFVTTIGYRYLGSPFSMPLAEVVDTAPFSRYYKGYPQYEHFYSTNGSEHQFLVENGYEYEGSEGDVYLIQKPGTVPLHRYTRFDPSSSDLYHYYTITQNDPGSYGMQYEGVVGHVCPSN